MRIRYLILGFALFMLTGFVSHATAKTGRLKCTIVGTFTNGVETPIDTSDDNVSATFDQETFNSKGNNGIFQEEREWVPQPAVTTCPNDPGRIEFHGSST